MQGEAVHWWERRETVIALVIIGLIPLLWPTIPPLVDLPGHMGRYAVQLGYDDNPVLREWYGFKWSLIGNLGVDLLIIPMAKLFGVELGTKLIVIAIAALTGGGYLWIAREVHGRVPPTALFALPFVYGHPFMFGFVNFALAMALALCGFALWLRMARLGATRLRPYVFLPLSLLLWVCHTYGWGMLGVLAFSAELIRQLDIRAERGRAWWQGPFYAAWHCLPMAAPLVLMIAWRSGAVSGVTGDWFNWKWKWIWLTQTLRDRWWHFDIAALAIATAMLVFALFSRRLKYSRNLVASALFLAAVYTLLPRIVFGSAYADMRLTPYAFGIAIVAIRLSPRATPRFAATLAVLGLLFFGLRTAGTTASLAIAGRDQAHSLAALEHVPRGARLVSFVGTRCGRLWRLNRSWHLPGIAIVRRHAFSNDQWDMAGAQLLSVRKNDALRWNHDPSQVVTGERCPHDKWWPLPWSMARVPRAAFDYVWLIDPPWYDSAIMAGTTLVWTDGHNALYRIEHDQSGYVLPMPPSPAKPANDGSSSSR